LIWLRNEATMVKKWWRQWGAQRFFVGGGDGERKCWFYSGRRLVIYYRVCVRLLGSKGLCNRLHS